MAATVQLTNNKGEKVWRYTVDAKELLAQKDNPAGWRLVPGAARLSGWATPSGPRARISRAVAQNIQLAETVATATAAALVKAGLVQPAQPVVTDAELDAQAQPTGEESAGLNSPDPTSD